MDYRIKLKKLIESLEQNPDVEIVTARANYIEDLSDAEWLFNNLKTKKGFSLPDSFFDTILFVDTFELVYDSNIKSYSQRNEIDFRDVSMLMELHQHAGKKLTPDYVKGEEKALWDSFEAFDRRPDIGDNKQSVVSFMPGISPPSEPPIYFVDRDLVMRLSINYGEYIDAMLDMAGAPNWQLLYAYVEDERFNKYYNTKYFNDNYYDKLKKNMDGLSLLFPHVNYSKYYVLLENKKKDVNSK